MNSIFMPKCTLFLYPNMSSIFLYILSFKNNKLYIYKKKLDMFRYKNKVYHDMEIEFIKNKFIFSIIWVLDFVEIINVRNQFLFFWKFYFFESEDIFFTENKKVRNFLCY